MTMNVRPSLLVPGLVDRTDAGMVERGSGLCFEHQPPLRGLIAKAIGRDDLDGDLAIEGAVAGEVDLSHAAGPQRPEHLVLRQGSAWRVVEHGGDWSVDDRRLDRNGQSPDRLGG